MGNGCIGLGGARCVVLNPDSLVARVFGARYGENLMTVPIRSNASFVWRSLVWSREVLERGMAWRIGNGADVSVLEDRWVAGLDGPLKELGGAVEVEGEKVQCLMSANAGWDEGKVRRLFAPLVQEAILNTSIGEAGEKDVRVWRFDDKGLFSVKSAYLVAIDFYASHVHMSEPDQNFWSRMVWNVSIPPKARVFLWRAFKNFIPTSANLRAHHVPTSGICELCSDRWGSTEHALVFCPMIVKVWKESRFWVVLRRARGLTLIDIAVAVRGELGVEEYELWALMLWQLWSRICKLKLSAEGEVELVSEASCLALWEAYLSARHTVAVADRLGVELGERKWIRPARGRLRVDVDARWNPRAGEFGCGVVVRDHDGRLVAALAKPVSPSSSPMMAEVMAVVQGIVLCVEQDLVAVELFTDSFLAARLMADPNEEAELLPDDICDILRVARENLLVGVSHMYRSANSVAHELALRGASSSLSVCWTADFPVWLRELASEDIA